MKRIHISLTEEQHTNVLLLAELAEISASQVIRKILDNHEEQMIKAIKKLNRRGDLFT